MFAVGRYFLRGAHFSIMFVGIITREMNSYGDLNNKTHSNSDANEFVYELIACDK